MGDIEAWEGAAAAVHDETGVGAPVDAFELAGCCGLSPRPWARADARLEPDGTLWYPMRARSTRQHGLVAHELGHWALDRADEQQSEAGASYVAGALMLPRREYDRDLRATQWDLRLLQAKHLHVSAEMLARRIVELRDAVATILDQGRATRRVASPWLGDKFKRLSQFERELADRALESEDTVREGDLLWAFPMLDGPHRRVVLVCEAEQLSLRL